MILRRTLHSSILLFFSLFLLGSCTSKEQLEAIVIVERGQTVNATPIEKNWVETAGAIRGHGLYHLLYANPYIEDADFRMEATISLERVDSTTALLMLFNNHFGFDSKAGETHSEGHFFLYSPQDKYFRVLGRASDHITPGQPFQLQLSRRDTLFEVAVNDVTVATIPQHLLTPPFEGFLAFRPWINTINVYDWTIEGQFHKPALPEFVFRAGEAGYVCFRIPAVLRTSERTLLAFAEGRKDECWSDSGDTDIVLKRSTDGGKTWGKLEIIWNDGGNACHAPTPILDRVNQRVVLLACRSLGTDHFKKFKAGKNEDIVRAFALEADLEGKNWSTPWEITTGAIPDSAWWFGTGPGSAIQLKYGPHTGRLVAGAHLIQQRTNEYYSMAIFSDDFGKTWQAGQKLPLEGGNESEIVQFPSGDLMINSRNYSLIDLQEKRPEDQVSHRIVALSKDGGQSWQQARRDSTLIEPVCQGSLLYLEATSSSEGLLFFSNPPHAKERKDLTVKASPNQGQSWPYAHRIYDGRSAYSDLVDLGQGRLGCLFECGRVWAYEGIAFRSILVQDIN